MASPRRGAGILPAMRDPDFGQWYFLFPIEGDALGVFGGRFEPHEYDIANGAVWCAVREFIEESIGLVSPYADTIGLVFRDPSRLQDSLLDEEKLLFTVINPARTYTTFVLEIPWDADVRRRFRRYRVLLGALATLVRSPTRALPLISDEYRALFPSDRAERTRRHEWLRAHPATVTRHIAARGKWTVDGVMPHFLEKSDMLIATIPQLRSILATSDGFAPSARSYFPPFMREFLDALLPRLDALVGPAPPRRSVHTLFQEES